MFLFHLCMAVELGERRGAVCVLLTKEGEREGGWLRRQGGGAVAGRGMARPLHDDDDDELHRVPQAKITNWGVVAGQTKTLFFRF